MNKCKKLLSVALLGTMLVSSTMGVHAADVTVTGDSSTGTTESTFAVTSDMLGGDLVVSIPADLDLTLDAGQGKFLKEDYVTVKGNIEATKKLDISVAEDNTWTIQETMSNPLTCSGIVKIGSEASAEKTIGSVTADMTTITYTASEVRASNSVSDNRPVVAEVTLDDIPTIGTYKASVDFYIQVLDAE